MAIQLVIKVEDYDNGGFKHLLVDAVMLNDSINNVTHFVHRNRSFGEYWVVTEYITGAQIGRGWSVSRAIEKAIFNINKVGEEEYWSLLDVFLTEHGRANLEPIPAGEENSHEGIEEELKALYDAEQVEDLIELSE